MITWRSDSSTETRPGQIYTVVEANEWQQGGAAPHDADATLLARDASTRGRPLIPPPFLLPHPVSPLPLPVPLLPACYYSERSVPSCDVAEGGDGPSAPIC